MAVLRSDCIYTEIEPVWGRWWSASTQVDFNDHNTFMTGRLTGSSVTGFKLEVDDADEDAWSASENKTILGITTGGRKITLLGCSCTSSSSYGLNPRCIYKPTLYFDGGHFPNPEDLDFTQVSFGLHGLEEWIDPRIEMPMDDVDNFSAIALSPLFATELLSTPNARVNIEEERIHHRKRGELQLLIESKLRVVIKTGPNSKLSWGFFRTESTGDSFSALADTVKEVLSLASAAPVYMYDMEVRSEKHKREIAGVDVYDPVKVNWNVLVRGDKSAYKKTSLNDWKIDWSDINIKADKYFTAWHENKSEYAYIESILSASKFEGTMFVDQRFIDLYSGINGLFQSLYPERSQDFLLTSSKDLADLICDYLSFISDFLGNDLLLSALCEDLSSVARVMFSGKSPATVLSSGYGPKFAHLNVILASSLRMGLMHKAGFDNDEIKEISTKDRYLRWALDAWKSNKRAL